MPSLETDYLVIGAGATGLAFTDALVSASHARVLLVDRRDAPGGHWNDAYPFVRLHQPSAYYGVNSLALGHDGVDEAGVNAGGYERATAPEVRDYFARALHDVLLPTGRVEYLPLVDYVGDAEGRHALSARLTGEVTEVEVRRRVVDARFNEPSIPFTHALPFGVDDATVVAPNDLVRTSGASGYTVIGAGKTAMDTCAWLLENGVDPERIRWVRPREAWLLNRAYLQPLDQVSTIIEGVSLVAQAVAESRDAGELFSRLEECEVLLRIDHGVVPSMFRCATVSAAELAPLRQITNVVRLGRVRHVGRERLELDAGSLASDPREVHVDCTADGLTTPQARPMFEPGRITLQQVRTCQPTFNAALIGFVEALDESDEARNALCPTNPYPRSASEWLDGWIVDQRALGAWARSAPVTEWLEASRLNAARGVGQHSHEPRMSAALERYFTFLPAAIERAGSLRAA